MELQELIDNLIDIRDKHNTKHGFGGGDLPVVLSNNCNEPQHTQLIHAFKSQDQFVDDFVSIQFLDVRKVLWVRWV